jgi:hypothetical protein
MMAGTSCGQIEAASETFFIGRNATSLVIPRATPPMNPGRISFFVTDFADESGGHIHVAVFPAQFRGDLLGLARTRR